MIKTHFTPADLFPAEPIRLAEISCSNWGTFKDIWHAKIHPDGTLVTGQTGAGKSTLIDALQPLLLQPSQTIFNTAAAQSDKNDRSLVSYVRGKYKEADTGSGSIFLRSGPTISVVRARYVSGKNTITLLALFWLTDSSSKGVDVKRLYFIALRDLSILEVLKSFKDWNRKDLVKAFANDESVRTYETFTEYQLAYRNHLYMENPNAPALLVRALGLKKIDDLTVLMQGFVLDPTDIRSRAAAAVAAFADLKATYETLVDLQEQQMHMQPLVEHKAALEGALETIRRLNEQRAAIPIYLSREYARLWNDKITASKADVTHFEGEVQRLQRRREGSQKTAEEWHAQFLSAGGSDMERMQASLEEARRTRDEIFGAAGQYDALVKHLGFDSRRDETVFKRAQDGARAELENVDVRALQLVNQAVDAATDVRELERQRASVRDDLADIMKRPNSGIDRHYQVLRDEMAQHLSIPADAISFIGELIDVGEPHEAWRGAIERALGGARTTLAVDKKFHRLVTQWLKATHTGLNVDVEMVEPISGAASFFSDGYLRKLTWREHPFRDWAKRHLARRGDLHCVDNKEQLDDTIYSIIMEGLIHYDANHFNKNDRSRIDDRRTWQIGFSNASRLVALRKDDQALTERIIALSKARDTALKTQREFETRISSLKNLLQVSWERIDVDTAHRRIEQIAQSIDEMEKASADMAACRRKWIEAKAAYDQDVDFHVHAQGDLRGASAQLNEALRRYEHYSTSAQKTLHRRRSTRRRIADWNVDAR